MDIGSKGAAMAFLPRHLASCSRHPRAGGDPGPRAKGVRLASPSPAILRAIASISPCYPGSPACAGMTNPVRRRAWILARVGNPIAGNVGNVLLWFLDDLAFRNPRAIPAAVAPPAPAQGVNRFNIFRPAFP